VILHATLIARLFHAGVNPAGAGVRPVLGNTIFGLFACTCFDRKGL